MRRALAALLLVAFAGCERRWTATEREGAFTIVQQWKEDRLDWEGTSRGVRLFTIESKHGVLETRGLMHERKGPWMLADTGSAVHVLDATTGKGGECVDCTCETTPGPFGPALVGHPWYFNERETSAFLYDETTAKLCLIRLTQPVRYSAVALKWSTKYPRLRAIQASNDAERVVAVGCDGREDAPSTCALLEVGSTAEPVVLDSLEKVYSGRVELEWEGQPRLTRR